MNADAVQAATEALFGHWKVADDETSQRVASLAARRDAEAAVAAAEPTIRAAIAAEIEAKRDATTTSEVAGYPFWNGYLDALDDAAHIARGGTS